MMEGKERNDGGRKKKRRKDAWKEGRERTQALFSVVSRQLLLQ